MAFDILKKSKQAGFASQIISKYRSDQQLVHTHGHQVKPCGLNLAALAALFVK